MVVKSLFGSHQENVARLPALRNEWMRGVARLEKDNAPVQWPQSEGGDPTEGLALGWLLRKPTPNWRARREDVGRKKVERWNAVRSCSRCNVLLNISSTELEIKFYLYFIFLSFWPTTQYYLVCWIISLKYFNHKLLKDGAVCRNVPLVMTKLSSALLTLLLLRELHITPL